MCPGSLLSRHGLRDVGFRSVEIVPWISGDLVSIGRVPGEGTSTKMTAVAIGAHWARDAGRPKPRIYSAARNGLRCPTLRAGSSDPLHTYG